MTLVHCRISFTDGTHLSLEWQRPTENDARVSGLLEKILANESLAIEVEGKLMLIPVNNVKTLEVSPSPEKLPNTVVRGARIV